MAKRIERIGIALAAYEPDPKTFEVQLRSIEAQDFKNWVCVVSCDSEIEKFAAHPLILKYISDPRFIWVENSTRLGHKKNFEHAIRLLVAVSREGTPVDAIAFSDQDDFWYPNKLERLATVLEALPPLSIVHSDMDLLDTHPTGDQLRKDSESGKSVRGWAFERRGVHHANVSELLVRNVVAGASALMDADLARRFPIVPEGFQYHDHWYAVAAASNGVVRALEESLFAYRQHPQNVVGISPFIGILARRDSERGIRATISKLKRTWTTSFRVAKAAKQAFHCQSAASPMLSKDFGLRLFFMFFKYLVLESDPALARSCLAKGLGKLLALNKAPGSAEST